MKMNFARTVMLALMAFALFEGPTVLAQRQIPDWGVPPDEFRDVARSGFQDGIEGARRDFENHRRPDVNNRDEYRHPHVSFRDRGEYRRGFERGYRLGVEHLYGGRRAY